MKKRVIIIGGGYAGILSAIEVLRAAPPDTQITLLEKTESLGGPAYSPSAANDFHKTNIAAKNMWLTAPDDLLEATAMPPQQVISRRLFGQFLSQQLAATQMLAAAGTQLIHVQGQAVDIVQRSARSQIKLLDGQRLNAHAVLLAAGGGGQRQLPCVTETRWNNPAFSARYVRNQWTAEGQNKIAAIPNQARVLILGTALSAYDAARTLLRRGHKGQIVMMSRNGLEHFQYDENQILPDIDLPRPRFLDGLDQRGWTHDNTRRLTEEFLTLTGLKVDLAQRTVEKASYLRAQFFHYKRHSPEQVLRNWERHVPYIASVIGPAALGDVLQQFTSLLNVLRVGAGFDVCEEIKSARRKGQLTVVAADINVVESHADGMKVHFRKQGRAQSEAFFHTIVSSLGPDHDFRHTQDELWNNLFRRGYTSPHPVKIGVEIRTDPEHFGHLPGASGIFAAGACAAGAYLLKNGRIGPPAFSVPGMRADIKKTAQTLALTL